MSGIIRVYQGLQIGQIFLDDSTEVTMVKNVKLSTNKVTVFIRLTALGAY